MKAEAVEAQKRRREGIKALASIIVSSDQKPKEGPRRLGLSLGECRRGR
jgi:hypothetical protein